MPPPHRMAAVKDLAGQKRSERRRQREAGLSSCSVVVPAALVIVLQRIALVAASQHRAGASSTLPEDLELALRRALPAVPLDSPAIPLSTRRAVTALAFDLGIALWPTGPGGAASASAGQRPAGGRRASVPQGWRVPEPSGKRPSDKQVELARSIAWAFEIDPPELALKDRRVLSAWISLHAEEWKREGSRDAPSDFAGPAFLTEQQSDG